MERTAGKKRPIGKDQEEHNHNNHEHTHTHQNGSTSKTKKIKAIDQSVRDHMSSLSSQDAADKQKRVTKACVVCQRAHMSCDSGRPCKRCIDKKVVECCVDPVPKPRGRKHKALDSSSNQESPNSTELSNDTITQSDSSPTLISSPVSSPLFNNAGHSVDFEILSDQTLLDLPPHLLTEILFSPDIKPLDLLSMETQLVPSAQSSALSIQMEHCAQQQSFLDYIKKKITRGI